MDLEVAEEETAVTCVLQTDWSLLMAGRFRLATVAHEAAALVDIVVLTGFWKLSWEEL